jgi:uncharacterized protein (DUF1330 family)
LNSRIARPTTDTFLDVIERHSGTLLAADESPQVVEGEWDGDKVVLLTHGLA